MGLGGVVAALGDDAADPGESSVGKGKLERDCFKLLYFDLGSGFFVRGFAMGIRDFLLLFPTTVFLGGEGDRNSDTAVSCKE